MAGWSCLVAAVEQKAGLRALSRSDVRGLIRCFGAARLLWFRAGVLWQSRGGKDAMAQEFIAGAAEHLPLDGLPPADLSFDRACAPALGDAGADGGQVAGEALRKQAKLALAPK